MPTWSSLFLLPFVLSAALACDRKPAPEPPKPPEPSEQAQPGASRSSSQAEAGAASSAREGAAPEVQAPQARRVTVEAEAMGTTVMLVAFTQEGMGDSDAKSALQKGVDEVRRLENLLSEWRDDTDIGRVNVAQGVPTVVTRETFAVLDKGLWAGKISEGAFDITFDVMSKVWKFGDAREKEPKLPDAATVQKLRALVDYRVVRLDAAKSLVTLPKGRRIGLGGIAKGYAVDSAARVIRGAGLRAFLVQAGGDLYGEGRKPDGSPWVSGIQDPRGKKNEFFATIELEDHAFSTAGDYARAFVKDGKRYHHIIDPRTGYPATASRSVTVWAPDAFTADAIDDAVFILGPKEGLKLVESLDGVGAVIVDANNKVWVSERIKNSVKITHAPTPGL